MKKNEKKTQVKQARAQAILGTMCRVFGIHPNAPLSNTMLQLADELTDTYLPINTAVYLELKEFAKTLPKGKNKSNLLYVINKIEGTK